MATGWATLGDTSTTPVNPTVKCKNGKKTKTKKKLKTKDGLGFLKTNIYILKVHCIDLLKL
jgi:hypothetical protein